MTEQKERNFEEKDCKARSISLARDANPSLAINRDVNLLAPGVIPSAHIEQISILAYQSLMVSFDDM